MPIPARLARLLLPVVALACAAWILPTAALAQTTSRVVEEGGTGPYPALMLSEESLTTHTVFRPADLSPFGDGHALPVLAWGNGACANSPWEHVNFLNEVASHGFLVVAIGPMPAGEGEQPYERSASSQLTDAIDWAVAQNGTEGSDYYGRVDTANVAVSGMSCGGLQTLEVAGDPRVTTVGVFNSGILPTPAGGMPGMPALAKDRLADLHTPTLYLLGGETDIAYNNGMDDYRRIEHVPVAVANLDVGHGGTYREPHGGEFARVATAWYLWQMRGDEEAGALFTGDPPGLAASPGWRIETKNID